MRRATLIAALLLLTPTVSQAKTLEELLVEKGVITKGEASGVSDAGASKVYWNKGTRIEFPDTGFTTSIATQIQARYTFTDNDEDSGLKNTSSFEMRRVRLIISGTALNKEFAYKLQTDFVGKNDGEGGREPNLRDAYIQWQPCDDASGIRMGQFKTAVSRQFNTDSSALQFVERSAVSDYFDLGRQNGAMAFGTFADGMVYGSAGIFNGESTGEGINRPGVDTKHTAVLSARVNPLGKMNVYEEGDIDWSEDAALSFGAAYAYSQFNDVSENVTDDTDAHTFSFDGDFKYRGWSANAEFFYQSVRPDVAEKSEPLGFYVQGGYFLTPKKLELAARYGYLDCDSGKAGGECAGLDNINEVSATINYYFWRHSLKAQLGYDFINEDSMSGGNDSDQNTNRWVFQISSYF
jgi:phosphate-selective porin